VRLQVRTAAAGSESTLICCSPSELAGIASAGRGARRRVRDNGDVSSRLRAIAEETVQIVGSGRYQAPGEGEVELAGDVAAAVAGTRMYRPDDPVPAATPAGGMPTVEVTGESTLTAARRLGGEVACLVFASARKPGGGFRNGAQAQEESLARSSALYACLCAVPEFYAFHRQLPDLR
jgi:uncharacterized protein (TIGR02452 family)